MTRRRSGGGRAPVPLLLVAVAAAAVAAWAVWQGWRPEPPMPVGEVVVEDPLAHILTAGLVVRVAIRDAEDAVPVVEALRRGGVTAIALQAPTGVMPEAVARVRARVARRALIGVAGVHTPEGVRDAVRAGAAFVLMPGVEPGAIQVCRDAGVLAIPGAFSATEVGQAWSLRTGLVALFPAGQVGPAYLGALLREMPGVALAAAGGITPGTAGEFLLAGAAAVVLTDEPDGAGVRDAEATTRRAQAFVAAVQRGRTGLAGPAPPARPVEGPDIK